LVLLAQISTSPTLTARIEVGGSIYRALERAPALDECLKAALETNKKEEY
jgi:hypothetical protein